MLKVLNDRVLIRKHLAREPVLVQLPESEHRQLGQVVAVGKKAYGLKAGDQVVFGKYVGNDVKIDGADYIIMQESDVFGVLCPP